MIYKHFKVHFVKIILKKLSIFYFSNYKLIVFKIGEKVKLFKINPKISLIFLSNQILIFTLNLNKFSNYEIKKITIQKQLLLCYLKKFLIEIQNSFFHKLKLVGIGFKVLPTKFKNVFSFKLGFSHFIYFKINNYKINIQKSTKLFLKTDLYSNVQFLLGSIRKLKIPDIYKGKGIYYFNQKTYIKVGKKI